MPGKTDYCLGLRAWQKGNYDDGIELLKLAAGWGNKYAQYTLGLIYYNGHHVSANPVLGMAWLKLADERQNDAQIALVVRSVMNLATPVQRDKSEQLFRQMRKKYGDAVAAVRAWHHLQHWKLSTYGADTGCIRMRGAQARAAVAIGLATPVILPNGDEIVCVYLKVQKHIVRKTAQHYFHGLFGTVNVGPLKTVPAPAASSGH